MLDLLNFIDGGKRDQIMSGTGAYIDDEFKACLDHRPHLGYLPMILLPAGRMKFAKSLHVKHQIHLLGQGGGLPSSWGITKHPTIMQFDPDQNGIVIHAHNTNEFGIEDSPTTGADNTIIEGIRFEGAGTLGHGIWMRAKAEISRCHINGFGENGVNIVADVRTSDPFARGNANNFDLRLVWITNCKGNGVYAQGGDVNAGKGDRVNVISCAGWGIRDSSFLGGKWDTCHVAGCKLGPYITTQASCRSVFDACYSEGGQPPSIFTPLTLIDGGTHGAGFVGGFYRGDGRLSPFKVIGGSTTRQVEYRMGVSGAGFDVTAQGDHPGGWSFGLWDEASKTVQVRHARLGVRTPLTLTTDLSITLLDEAGNPVGPGNVIMRNVLAPTTGGRYRKVDLFDLMKRIEALEAL